MKQHNQHREIVFLPPNFSADTSHGRRRLRPDLHTPKECLVSPRLLTIHVPKDPPFNHNSRRTSSSSSSVTRPPTEIVIGNSSEPKDSLPRTIQVKAGFTPPTEIVLETKKETPKDQIPDLIQVSSNLRRELTIPSQSLSGTADCESVGQQHGALEGFDKYHVPPSHQATNTRPRRGSLDEDTHEVRIRSHNLPQLGDDVTDIRHGEFPIPHPSSSASSERRSKMAADPPAAKAPTTTTHILPNFTDLMHDDKSRCNKSLPGRKTLLDETSFNQHPSWPPYRQDRIVPRKSMRKQAPHWLGVTGTPEDWIKPEEVQEIGRKIAFQRLEI